MPPATLKDIAKQLNLSPSTVSRALRNHPDISPGTKKKVACMAKKLDYHPNSIAQSLQTQKTKTIGVIVPEIKQPFFAAVINGIEALAFEEGFTIIVCQSNESYQREVVYTRLLTSHRVAGLLVSLSKETQKLDHFKLLLRRDIPIVFFDRVSNEIEADKVVVDDYQGAFDLVTHLIESGYQRIAHLAGPESLSICRFRLKGYVNAHRQKSMPIDDNLIVSAGLDDSDGAAGFETLWQLSKLPDAIFAVNDPVAIGAFMAIKTRGLKIPEDVALAGFSNTGVSSLLDPPLTTVEQPSYDIGRTAATLLMAQINGNKKAYMPQLKILKTQLIVREST